MLGGRRAELRRVLGDHFDIVQQLTLDTLGVNKNVLWLTREHVAVVAGFTLKIRTVIPLADIVSARSAGHVVIINTSTGPERRFAAECRPGPSVDTVAVGDAEHFAARVMEHKRALRGSAEWLTAGEMPRLPDRHAVGAASQATTAPAGFYPDPAQRADQRYWDGTQWTSAVVVGGVGAVDPLPGSENS